MEPRKECRGVRGGKKKVRKEKVVTDKARIGKERR